ncbi:MAG: CbiX/SirB N-terminal domain-containing protein [Planctomycetota bacterium]
MTPLGEQLRGLAGDANKLAIIVVDHGSRRQQSNALLDEVVAMFRRVTGFSHVEPAHMELAEPSIATAFDRCVADGADFVIVFPYFLSPGRHWSEDIPRLAGEAAIAHPSVRHVVTAPLGLHDAIASIMSDRIRGCLSRVLDGGETCDFCDDATGCRLDPS